MNRPIGIALTMRRTPIAAPVERLATPEVIVPSCRFGAGADNWADATEIPFGEMRYGQSEYTYNKDLTTEPDEDQDNGYGLPQRTAWWKIGVPAGKVLHYDASTKYTFGQEVATTIQMWRRFGSAPASLADMFPWAGNSIAGGDDLRIFPDATLRQGWSRLTGEEDEGVLDGTGFQSWSPLPTYFYFQVGSRDPDRYPPDESWPIAGAERLPMAYVLRLCLSETRIGDVPPDGHDPNE